MYKIITKWFGVFKLDQKNKIIAYKLFPKEPEIIAEKLIKIANNKILEEEKELAKGLNSFATLDKRLEKLGGKFFELKANFIARYENYNYDLAILQEASLKLAYNLLRTRIAPDLNIIQGITTIEGLIKAENLILESLSEWYGYYQEGSSELRGLELVDFITKKRFCSFKNELATLANVIQEIHKVRNLLESYISKKMEEIAPNLQKLAGPLLGAKLIAAAGSLQKLANLPASTIQILGAEKAFFKALRKRSYRLPKYGLIFQHPKVRQASGKLRGKYARVLANRLAIAARLDYYSKKVKISKEY